MSYSENWHPQDRWHQSSPVSDYATMGSMVYDPRTLPSTTAIPRSTMAPHYSLPTTYGESPVTPIATPSYSGQGQYGGYQPYQYQPPTTNSYMDQTPMRHSQRLMAPPTPPLDDEQSLRYHQDRTVGTVKSTACRSPRRSVSVVKSEACSETSKEIRTCSKQVTVDGKTLVKKFDKTVDKFLAVAKNIEMVLPIRTHEKPAATPESMASPSTEEDHQDAGRPQPKKDKQCKYCPRRFAQTAQLNTHMRAHTGDKPYQCDICFKCVSQPGNLKAHKRRHTGEKRYECPVCHAKFAANGGMKNHIRKIHDGEPKQPCPIPQCDKSFTTIGNMKVHINKYHEAQLFRYMDMISQHDSATPFPEDVAELWGTLLRIYKNSNCGIKGRGVDSKEMKEIDKKFKEHFKREQATCKPISPESSSTVNDYRVYYDQNHQQNYSVRSDLSQPPQHQSGYVQQQPLPMHHTPQVYHGLPQPTAYNMGWTPQYH